jgi:diacylglycerol kinase (ATP)
LSERPHDPIVLIANPVAASGRAGRLLKRYEADIRRVLSPRSILLTEAHGDAMRLAEKAVLDGARTLISLGGDGTHHEVANGIMAHPDLAKDVQLGLLPMGTGGDLRRALLQPDDVRAALASLVQAPSFPVDILDVTYTTDSGDDASCFVINLASFGLSGSVDRAVNRAPKHLGGKLTFLLASIASQVTFKPPSVRLLVDGEETYFGPITSIMLGNSRWAGGGMKLTPEARMADGLIDIVLFEKMSLIQSVRLTPAIYKGHHIRHPAVRSFRGRSIEIQVLDERPVYLDADGESPGGAPARVSVRPKALRLLNVNPDLL